MEIQESNNVEGSKHYFVMNKFSEEINLGDIEGQDEIIPVDGRDYVLQMIVSPTHTTVNSGKTIYHYVFKRIGGWKLVAIPSDDVKQRIEKLDE